MRKIVLSLACISMFTHLNANETNLEEVLVTAKVKSEAIDTAGSFNIVGKEDLKTSNANSVQEILEETVGINVSANNRSINGRKNITFRGMNPEHTAILINGKRISNTDAQIGHSDFQYNWIPLSAISKMEIVRGSMSSIYGSKALGGVVNIITKKPKKKFEGFIDLKLSSTKDKDMTKSVSLNLAGNINEKFAISVFAEKSNIDAVENKKDKNQASQFEGKDVSNIMLDAWYTIDDTQELSASIIRGKELRDAVSFDLFKTINENGKESYSNFDKLYEIDKEHYSLSYNKFFDIGFLNLKAYRTASNVHNDSFRYTHKLNDDALNAEFTFENLDNHYLVIGTDFRKESYEKSIDKNNTISKSFKDDINYKSLYAQDEIEINDKLLITLGARLDKHEMFDAQLSPKIFGVYKLSENQRLKTGYGRGFNAPTLSQLSDEYKFFNQNAGHGFVGNSKLKPEISDTYEFGYEYQGEQDLFKTTIFYTELKDLIASEKTDEVAGADSKGKVTYYEKYSNIKSSQMYGLELEYTKNNLLNNLDFNVDYTYLKTKDDDKNRELSFRPQHKINTSFKYHFDKTMFVNLSIAYTGEQKNYNDLEGELTNMDAYVTSKIQLSKNFSKNLNLRAGIDNITNQDLAEKYNYQLKSRTFYTNINYKF